MPIYKHVSTIKNKGRWWPGETEDSSQRLRRVLIHVDFAWSGRSHKIQWSAGEMRTFIISIDSHHEFQFIILIYHPV